MKMNVIPAETKLSQLMCLERAYQNDAKESSSKDLYHSEFHNTVWREMVVQWCYNVVDHIQADREIVYVAINVLDRFLASQISNPSATREYLTDRKDYEAAVMASLLITLKLQGNTKLSVSDLMRMSRSSVTSKDILKAAEAIVQNLTWDKELPTTASLVRAFINILSTTLDDRTKQELFDECIFSIELCVFDTRCSCELPSQVAWMVLENALSSHGLSDDIIHSFRTDVEKLTCLKYNQSLRDYLYTLRERGLGDNIQDDSMTSRGPTIIPPDDEEENEENEHQEIMESMSSSFTLHPRPITHVHVVSMDIISEPSQSIDSAFRQSGKRQGFTDPTTLPRSKRCRSF